MKKGLKNFYTVAYLILSVLVLLMIIGTIIAVVQGKTDILTGGLAFVVFALFAVLQVICLSIYKPGLSLYKIGFYLLHIGLLVMLVGFLAYALAGESLNVNVPVNATGNFYNTVQNEDGEKTDLGFGLRINDFVVEKYEDTGNDKYYRADLTFVDPTTLIQEESYLEVNHTQRRNGWKIYLMSYNDGSAYLQNTYRLTDDDFYGNYSADGATSGEDLVSLIQQDLGGYFYTYYMYISPDNTDGYFQQITEEELATQPGTLYAHTFAEGNQVSVYINRKLRAFDESITANGEEILAHVADKYADRLVHYYYYTADSGIVHSIEENYVKNSLTDSMAVEISATDSAVSVYIMQNKQFPDKTLTVDGGSALTAGLIDAYGEETVDISYQLFDYQKGIYKPITSPSDILSLSGNLKGYALAMGDSLVVYVHPVTVHLFVKHDPGEFVVLAGLAMLFVGTVLTCLIKGRKKSADDPDSDPNGNSIDPAKQKRKTAATAKKGATK